MKLARRGLLATALALPVAASAERFAGRYDPRAQRIADGIWMVRGKDGGIVFANGGAIANSAILASDGGAIVFDPGPSLQYGKALAALALKVTGKPVGRVFVSHLHPDHAFGAAAFDPGIVYALAETAHEIERDGPGFSDAMYRLLAGWMTGTEVIVPPGRVEPGPLEFGGRKFVALALQGHSMGDLALLDEATGTLLAGDLVFLDRAPATPDADPAKWRAALDTLAATPHRLLVPGHGPLDETNRGIAQTRDWLDWLETSLKDAVARGLDMSEAGALAIPPRFAAMKAARYELQRSVSHFYARLEAETLPRIDR